MPVVWPRRPGRVSRYEAGRIIPSAEALVRIAETLNVSIDHLLIDGIPRRPLRSAQDALGDRLAAVTELPADDLASLLNIIDGLVAKNRLKTLAGGLGQMGSLDQRGLWERPIPSCAGPVIPMSTPERASLYRSLLADRRVLVLADDAASAAQVQHLLPGTGQCAVLITSRSELVSPPGARLLPLEPLANAEAVQLLTQILGQRRIADEPGAAEELADACGLLPLAVAHYTERARNALTACQASQLVTSDQLPER